MSPHGASQSIQFSFVSERERETETGQASLSLRGPGGKKQLGRDGAHIVSPHDSRQVYSEDKAKQLP